MITDKEKISTISSILIIVGCLLPWKELMLIKVRGYDIQTGGIVLAIGIVTLGISIFNILSKSESSKVAYNKFLGFIALSLLASEHFGLRQQLKESNLNPEVANIGIGIYISFLGSLGVLITDINLSAIKSKVSALNIPLMSIKKENIVELDYQAQNEEGLAPETEVNTTTLTYNKRLIQLNELIVKQKKSLFGNEFGTLALQLINDIVQSKEDATLLLEKYQNYFDKDLIEELKSFSSSYPAIKKNFEVFIEMEVVEEKYPHIKIKN